MKKEDLVNVWKDIGMHGPATPTQRRCAPVKTCVGSGVVPLRHAGQHADGQDLEEDALWRMYAPHKVKLAVRLPAQLRRGRHQDVGVIGVDSGWEIYVAGNGGIKTEVAQFLVKLKTAAEVLEYSGAFLQLYREEGWYLERTCHWSAGSAWGPREEEDPRRRRGPQAPGSACSSASTASPTRGSSSTRPRVVPPVQVVGAL